MKSRKVSEMLGVPSLLEQEQNCPEICMPKQRVGCEFEWEHAGKFVDEGLNILKYPKLTNFNKYFVTHSDGSLRHSGCEFVFNGPMAGSRILTALEIMEELSRVYGFSASYRTSLHVHLDMQDVRIPEDIDNYNVLYCIFERFLYKFVGKNRETSNYCVPWYMHPQHFQVYKKVLKNHGATDAGVGLVSHLKNSKTFKYSGLNMFSLGDFGTIEHRQAPVDMQRDKIITWINILMRPKKWLLAHKNVQGEDIFTYLEKAGPYYFMQEVFQEQFKELWKFSKNPLRDIQEGLDTAYHYLATV